MEKEYKSVGEKIRELRKDKGVMQITVATEVGIVSTYQSLLETGGRDISEDILPRIAEYFEITTGELLKDTYIEKYGYKWILKETKNG